MPHPNGSVPAELLGPATGSVLGVGALLRHDAARSWNRARTDALARTGITLGLRGWNRTLAEQERFFLERYTPRTSGSGPFGDVRYYRGVRYVRTSGAAAAIPGTSNHGWGVAVDVADYGTVGQRDLPRRIATYPILAEHGWTETEGWSISEPWHLVYVPELDRHVPAPSGGGAQATRPPATITPAPPTSEEDDMTPDQAKQLAEVHWMLGQIRGTDLPPIREQTNRLPRIHAGLDILRAAVQNVTNGLLTLLGRKASPAGTVELADADLDAIARAVADEQARRLTNGA